MLVSVIYAFSLARCLVPLRSKRATPLRPRYKPWPPDPSRIAFRETYSDSSPANGVHSHRVQIPREDGSKPSARHRDGLTCHGGGRVTAEPGHRTGDLVELNEAALGVVTDEGGQRRVPSEPISASPSTPCSTPPCAAAMPCASGARTSVVATSQFGRRGRAWCGGRADPAGAGCIDRCGADG